MASSRWYMGFDHTSGTVERELKGVVFGQYEVSFSVGGAVRVTATGFYGDEARNTSITPGTYVGETAEAMTFDGGTIEIPDSTTLTKVQEGTLTIENISRLQRGMQRKPIDAVVQNPQTSLNLQKIVTDASQLTLAYGDTTSPVESSNVSGAATGKLTFTTTGTAEVAFALDGAHQVADLAAGTESYQDTGLNAGDQRYYVVEVFDSSGASHSNEASGTTKVIDISNLQVSKNGTIPTTR